MVEAIVAHLMDALEEAKKLKPSREVSLVITKIEEAMLWYSQDQRVRSKRD